MRARLTISVTREEIAAAITTLDEAMNSPVFDPWPFMEPLEFVEKCLKRHRQGIARLCESGLMVALMGECAEMSSRRALFRAAREFGAKLSRILDRGERDPEIINPERLRTELRQWSEHLPA